MRLGQRPEHARTAAGEQPSTLSSMDSGPWKRPHHGMRLVRVPVICVRSMDERHRLTRETIGGRGSPPKRSARAGSRGFVDFFDYPDGERGRAAIRAAIDALR